MTNAVGSNEIPALPAPTEAPVEETSTPGYTRRGWATFLQIVIGFWCAGNFFVVAYNTFFLLALLGPKSRHLFPFWQVFILALVYMGFMAAYPAITDISGKVITSPRYLHQDRMGLYRFLCPLIISIVYFLITALVLGGTLFDLLELIVLTLALIGMLRPTKNDILVRCFVPFAVEKPTNVPVPV